MFVNNDMLRSQINNFENLIEETENALCRTQEDHPNFQVLQDKLKAYHSELREAKLQMLGTNQASRTSKEFY